MKRPGNLCRQNLVIIFLVTFSFSLWGCSDSAYGTTPLTATPISTATALVLTPTPATTSTPLAPTQTITPTFTPTIKEYKIPNSINDIPIPPQATEINYRNSREVNFFVPLSTFENFSDLDKYFQKELPLSGWQNCRDFNCNKQFVTMTDAAYSFYSFNPAQHKGPFLQLLGCPDEIVYCKEATKKDGGFPASLMFID